jgi:hypothetical protein
MDAIYFASANARRPPGRSMRLFLTGLLIGFSGHRSLWQAGRVSAFARKESKS